MCHFITAVLPVTAKIAELVGIAAKHHRKLVPLHNAHLVPQLKNGEVDYLTTSGPCDCGTALGAQSFIERQQHDFLVKRESTMKDLRKKGWGETKIRRWMDQTAESESKRLRVSAQSREELTPGVDAWISLLKEMLDSRHTLSCGLLLHMYSGSPATERLHLLGRKRLPIGIVTAADLLSMQEDVLYDFVS